MKSAIEEGATIVRIGSALFEGVRLASVPSPAGRGQGEGVLFPLGEG